MAYESTPYDDYALAGLSHASNIGQNRAYMQYPEYTPSQTQAPVKSDYYQYTSTPNLSNVATPNYKYTAGDAPAFGTTNTNAGWQDWNYNKYNVNAPNYRSLMSGDYDALQTALTTPGEIAARTAYDQGQNRLINQMGGNGLYGSSIMQNQAINSLDSVYQNALASNAANAAAQRYAMQQTDLSNMSAQELAAWKAKMDENTTAQGLLANQNIARNQAAQSNADRALSQMQSMNNLASTTYGQNLSREQDANQFAATLFPSLLQQANDQYKANYAETQNRAAYDLAKLQWDKSYEDSLNAWKNAQAFEKYQYNLSKRADYDSYIENMINTNLAIAGQGAPLVASANSATAARNNYLQAIEASNNAYKAAQTNAWLGAAGTIGAGLLKSDTALSAIGSGLSSVGSGISNGAGMLWDGFETLLGQS